MDNLRSLLGIRRMDKVPNARLRRLRVTKSVDEKIDEGVLRWFSHVEKMAELQRGSMNGSGLVVSQ